MFLLVWNFAFLLEQSTIMISRWANWIVGETGLSGKKEYENPIRSQPRPNQHNNICNSVQSTTKDQMCNSRQNKKIRQTCKFFYSKIASFKLNNKKSYLYSLFDESARRLYINKDITGTCCYEFAGVQLQCMLYRDWYDILAPQVV